MFVPILIVAATWTTSVLAHWNYNTLIINGQVVGEPYQYIRRTNNSNSPLQMVNSTDMRCNAGASSGTSLGTETLTVTTTDQESVELGFGIESTFGHPGIQQVYLSRAPDGTGAADYDGAGGWVKIYAATTLANASFNGSGEGLEWAMRRAHSFRFPLSGGVPPGEYLLRAEGLALHAAHKLDWCVKKFSYGVLDCLHYSRYHTIDRQQTDKTPCTKRAILRRLCTDQDRGKRYRSPSPGGQNTRHVQRHDARRPDPRLLDQDHKLHRAGPGALAGRHADSARCEAVGGQVREGTVQDLATCFEHDDYQGRRFQRYRIKR